MLDKMKQLYELQKKAKSVQRELKETEIEVKSNDGRVVVLFNGEQHLQSVKIDPSLLNEESKNDLEKILERTISEGISRAQAIAAEKSKALMKDMNLNIPGM